MVMVQGTQSGLDDHVCTEPLTSTKPSFGAVTGRLKACIPSARTSSFAWKSSTRSAFRLTTFVPELTVNGATPPATSKVPAGPVPVLLAFSADEEPPVTARTPIPEL